MRDRLRAAPTTFHHLDAAQLVKHAFGIVTEARRSGKKPVLVYLYAEPTDKPPSAKALIKHRTEIKDFSDSVDGGMVRFVAVRWTEWLDRMAGPNGWTEWLDRMAGPNGWTASLALPPDTLRAFVIAFTPDKRPP